MGANDSSSVASYILMERQELKMLPGSPVHCAKEHLSVWHDGLSFLVCIPDDCCV